MAERASDPVAEGVLAAATEPTALLSRRGGGDRWVHDRVNAEYADLVGADSPSSLRGTAVAERIAGQDRDRVTAALSGVVEGADRPAEDEAGGWEGTVTLLDADGDGIGATLSAAPAGDRVAVTVRADGRCDRADHAAVEAAIDAVEDLFLVVDGDGDVVRMNDAVERALGYDRSDFEGRRLPMFAAEEHRDRVPDSPAKLTDEAERTTVVDTLDDSGRPIPYEYRGRTFAVEGEPYWAAVGREMTERERRERLLASLSTATETIQRATTPQDACRRAVEAANEILGWEHTACWLHDADADELVPVTGHRAGELRLAEGDPEWTVFETGEPDTVAVNETHPEVDPDIGTAMVFPLGDHGVMGAADSGADEYDDEALDTLAILTGHLRTALDRIERERDLRRERDRFTVLFDSVPEPVVQVAFEDGDPVVRNVNPAFETTFGHDAEAAVGEDIDDLVVPPDREDEAAEMNDRALAGRPVEREVRRLAADGERDFLIRSRPSEDRTGNPEAICVYVDVTERERRRRELREVKRQYQTLVENYPEGGVFLFDGDLRYVRAGGTELEAVGLSPGDVVGATPHDLFPEALADELAENYRAALSGEANSFEQSYRGQRYRIRTVPIHDDDGGVARGMAVSRNVTEREERERELQRQRDELATLNRINELLLSTTRALSDAPSRSEVEATVCERLATSELYRFAWIGDRGVDDDRIRPRSSAGDGEGYLDAVAVEDDGRIPGHGPAGEAIRTGEVQVVADARTDPGLDHWRGPAVERGFRSAAAVPLVHGGATYGVLAVYADRPEAFGDRELDGLRTLGETVGFVLNAIGDRKLLVADTVTELELVIGSDDALLARASTQLDCTITLDGYTAREDHPSLLYVSVEGADPAGLVDIAEADDAIEAARVLSETDDGGRVELHSTGGSSVRAALDAGAAVTEATASEGVTRLTVEAPQSVDTRAVVDRIADLFDEAELIATCERDRPVRTAADLRESIDQRLTDRRLEALRTAYLSGYFEWPREADAETVAESMGITSPTLHSHLRKAQNELLSVLFEAGPVGTDRT